jgi:hypothetical protein
MDGLLEENNVWLYADESGSSDHSSRHDPASDSDLEYQDIVSSILEPDSSREWSTVGLTW